MNAEKGELMSPGYPDNYKANMKCQWNIIVPKVSFLPFSFLLGSLIIMFI